LRRATAGATLAVVRAIVGVFVFVVLPIAFALGVRWWFFHRDDREAGSRPRETPARSAGRPGTADITPTLPQFPGDHPVFPNDER
jgi:hypothetical protein